MDWFLYDNGLRHKRVKYIFIVQDFIRAEKTSNWKSHIATTNFTLNLFAATGRINYAKTCRLHIQCAEELKSINPPLYSQFQPGNHIVKRTGPNWSGIAAFHTRETGN